MNLESFQGPNPLLSDMAFPFFDVATNDRHLKGHIDYLKSQFYEYKVATDKSIVELQQIIASHAKSIEEMSIKLDQLKEQQTGSKVGKRRSSRVNTKELSVSDVITVFSVSSIPKSS